MAEFSKPNVNNVWSAQGVMVAPDATKVQTGWEVEKPPREYFNWLEHRQDQFIAHVNQHGLPEWDAETEYQANKSYVRAANGAIFFCVTTHKGRNPLQDVSAGYWREAFGEDGVWANKIPRGVIVMWSGAVSDVPRGWRLCDGSGGTPDLRNRFIVGAGDNYSPGDTGGADSVALSVSHLARHTHAITIEEGGVHTHTPSMGSAGVHSHSGTTASAGSHHHNTGISGPGIGKIEGYTNNAPNIDNYNPAPTNTAGAHTHSFTTNSAGGHTHTLALANSPSHTHTATASETGSGAPHENRPPYYALAYIMKT